ncbi:MAG TPA: hypothetical protein VIJ07_15090, partial [Dermatophilaceae bacterium]
MVADFTRTDSLKMALASGLNGDLEPCVRDGCASRTADGGRSTKTRPDMKPLRVTGAGPRDSLDTGRRRAKPELPYEATGG